MGKNDGKGDSIYGAVPPTSDLEAAVGPAMKDLGSSSSNTINGGIKSKDVEYPEQ